MSALPGGSRLKRRMLWAAGNIAQCSLLYAWLVHDVEWAGNVMRFVAGLMLFRGVICFTKSMQSARQKKGRSVPAGPSQSVDFGIAIALASQAHFFMAGIYIFSMIAESAAFDGDDAKGSEAAK